MGVMKAYRGETTGQEDLNRPISAGDSLIRCTLLPKPLVT